MYKRSLARETRASSYSRLEERRLLAGNIRVVENVHLYIRGDAMDNQFEIVAEGDQLRINGLNGTTINGRDGVTVESATVTEDGVSFAGGLRVHLGPGHDDFAVKDAQFESMSLIYGGTGDDDIEVVGSRFLNKTTIQTFDGDDSISTSDSHFADKFFAITLDGEDTVTMVDSMLTGNSVIATGNHSDSIHSSGNRYMGDVNLILPLDSDDSVRLDNPVVGENQLGIFLGNGDDTISADLTEASVEGMIKIGGQGGNDRAPEMLMNDLVESSVSMATIESMQVFGSRVGGSVNVEGGLDGYLNPETNDGFRVAIPVVLDATQTISTVEWSGTYLREAIGFPFSGRADNFVIDIFEGAGDGAPLTSSVVQFEVGDGNRVDSGETLSQQGRFDYPVYEFSAEIDFTMEAGKEYWFSIYSLVDNEAINRSDIWLWGYKQVPDLAEAVQRLTWTADAATDGDDNFRFGGQDDQRPAYVYNYDLDLRLRT